MSSADETLHDKKFVQRYFGVSDSKVNRWVMSGTGPKHLKIDNLVRFRMSDLIAYMEDCVRGGDKNRAA